MTRSNEQYNYYPFVLLKKIHFKWKTKVKRQRHGDKPYRDH